MNRLSLYLSGLLALQLLLATGLFWEAQARRSDYEPKPLFNLAKGQIDKIAVSSNDDAVTLLKQGGAWALPEGLPVDQGKLDTLLTAVAELKTHWPVTTTTGSHQRFQVSVEEFQRRLQLYQDDEMVSDLFLGSSPAFRQVHVRSADDAKVYAAELNIHDFSAERSGWLDKALLAAKEVEAITGIDYGLKQSDGQWALTDPDGKQPALELDPSKADELSQALSSLRVTGIAEERPDFSSDEIVSLQVEGADRWRYQFLKRDETYYVKRDDLEYVFTLAQHDYDGLAGIRLSNLLLETAEGATEQDSAGDALNGEE